MHINSDGRLRAFNDGPVATGLGVSALLLTLALTEATQAAIYRCVEASGTTTYSDKPCAPAVPPNNDEDAAAERRVSPPGECSGPRQGGASRADPAIAAAHLHP